VDQRPAAVVEAESAADVAEAVRYARTEHPYPAAHAVQSSCDSGMASSRP
jgi:hypothetical protein